MLMLAGATVSVLKWLGIGPFGNGDAVGTEATGTTPGEPPRFVSMDVLVIPIFQGEKVAATVQIQLKLEAANLENECHARHVPRKSFYLDLRNQW